MTDVNVNEDSMNILVFQILLFSSDLINIPYFINSGQLFGLFVTDPLAELIFIGCELLRPKGNE
jgi:hypothetical protein